MSTVIAHSVLVIYRAHESYKEIGEVVNRHLSMVFNSYYVAHPWYYSLFIY